MFLTTSKTSTSFVKDFYENKDPIRTGRDSVSLHRQGPDLYEGFLLRQNNSHPHPKKCIRTPSFFFAESNGLLHFGVFVPEVVGIGL